MQFMHNCNRKVKKYDLQWMCAVFVVVTHICAFVGLLKSIFVGTFLVYNGIQPSCIKLTLVVSIVEALRCVSLNGIHSRSV